MNYTKIFALAAGALLWMSSCTSSSDLDKLPGAAVRTQQAISETVSKLEVVESSESAVTRPSLNWTYIE